MSELPPYALDIQPSIKQSQVHRVPGDQIVGGAEYDGNSRCNELGLLAACQAQLDLLALPERQGEARGIGAAHRAKE